MATYSGNPNNYPIALTIVDDSSPPNATNFNTPVEGLADQVAWLTARGGGLSNLVTLEAPIAWSVSGSDGPYAMVWNNTALAADPTAGQRWLAGATDSGGAHMQVFAGWGDGTANWVQVGGNITYTKTPTDIQVDSAGAIYVAGVGGIGSGEANLYKCPVGGSFTSFLVLSGLTTPSDLRIGFIGTSLFYAIGSVSSSQGIVGGGFGGGFTGLSVATWIVRSNGSMVLFVPNVAQASPTVYKAVGTATFTSASIGIGTSDIPQDLTWSAVLGLWVLVVKTGAGATTIWTSPEGSMWTLAQTLSHLPHPIVSVVAVGPVLVGVMANASAGNPSQLVSCIDGGVTWYAHPSGTVIASFTVPRVFGSPSRILSAALVGTNNPATGTLRSSGILGIGTQALT